MEKIQIRLLQNIKFNTRSKKIANSTIIATVIATELPRWNKVTSKGKLVPSKGLTERRAAEIALAQKPSSIFTYPCTATLATQMRGQSNLGAF